MSLYDEYQGYRDPNLSESEKKSIEEARALAQKMEADDTLEHRPNGFWDQNDGFIVHPVIKAHTMIAINRAEAQFQDHPVMPESEEICLRFPGMDPVGKYSVIDMKFAKREEAVMSLLDSRSPEVQKYVKELMDKRTSKKEADLPFNQRYYAMKKSAKTHRTLTRGSKLCLDAVGSKLMRQQARSMETDLAVTQYDMLLQGVEYAAGVRQGPVPKEITDFYKDTLKTELNLGIVAAAANRGTIPKEMHVHFQDLDNKLVQIAFADPENWKKSHDEVVKAADKVNVDPSVMGPYAEVSADRLIDPLFRDMEKPAPAGFDSRALQKQGLDIDTEFSRGDLISVDGKTVRELMKNMHEQYFSAGGQSFKDWYKDNVREMTNNLVASGLAMGKRVEAFVPDKFGRIPKEPTQITKTGYEPSPLKPEKFNAWQRHFAKYGFYKNKVARKEEYERVMAARDRMRLKATSSQHALQQDRTQALREAVGKKIALQEHTAKELIFDKVMEEHGFRSVTTTPEGKEQVHYDWDKMESITKNQYHTTKTYDQFTRVEPAAACIMGLMAKGHKYEDILNPTMLQKERQDIAQEFMEHAKTNDQEWLGRMYYKGFKAGLQQIDAAVRGLDLTNDAHLIQAMPLVSSIAQACYSAGQTLDEKNCQLGFHKAAMEEAHGDMAKGSAMANQLFDKVQHAVMSANALMDGIEAQLHMIEPQKKMFNSDIARSTDAVTYCALAAGTLAAMKPGVASFVDASPHYMVGGLLKGDLGMDPVVGALHRSYALDPQARSAFARGAANGSLISDMLHVTATPSNDIMYGNPICTLTKKEDGTLALEQGVSDVPYKGAKISFHPDKEIKLKEKEGPEMQQQAQQKKAPHRQAPHKKPPQPGERKL